MKRSGIAVGFSASLGIIIIMFQSYDYISRFLPFFNIAVSLGNLF